MTIRRQPSDFRVEERLDDAFAAALSKESSQAAPFAVYTLSKTSLTTPEAVSQVAKRLNTPQQTVEYGGLKDKHAETSQHISVAVRGKEQAAKLPPTIAAGGWHAERIGWSPQPVSAKAIAANRFTLVVRDLTKTASDNMTRRSRRLIWVAPSTDPSDPSVERRSAAFTPDTQRSGGPPQATLLFTNYFGAQRFGSARHGQGWIAEKLIAGDFENALKLAIATPARKDTGKTRDFTRLAAAHWGDWETLARELPRVPEKRCIDALAAGEDFKEAFAQLPSFLQALYVEAYQSHLWNRTAHALLAAHTERSRHLTADDEFGEMLFTDAAAIPAALRSLNLPLLAPSVKLDPPWGDSAAAVLGAAAISVGDLRIPGVKRPFFGAADRNLIAAAAHFSISKPAEDDLTPGRLKRTVAFELPRGAYATVVLRALGQ